MLHHLYVKNLALIDEMEIEFQEGLNILTGETGAGKSIILGSINLALGGRYSSEILRDENQPGYVELSFFTEKDTYLKWLQEKEISVDGDMVTLSRKFVGKRSICKINGETVSISDLKEIASILIDIHGQHEHQSLLYKKNHIRILDDFAHDNIKEVKKFVADTYSEYKLYKDELQKAQLDEKDRAKEMDFLRYEIEEIENADLKSEEDVLLEEQYHKMRNSKKISESLKEVYSNTGRGNQNASDLLSRAIVCLQDVIKYDEKAKELNEQLTDIDNLLNDFNRELGTYTDSLEFSEKDFYDVENRLNTINHLKIKYGNNIEEIKKYLAEKKEALERLENYDSYLEEMKCKLEDAEKRLKKVSQTLSDIRKKEAENLAKQILYTLQDLNFLEVKFEIVFSQKEEYSKDGVDDVEFMISMNPGQAVRALGEVASGGELSRIMLAIKTVMADRDDIETLIFDEIDVGISGRTAQKVSEKMALIGKSHQVICITHLAQIAAMADAHYAIEKRVEMGETKTAITLLNEEQEINELARILGGVEITQKVLESAAEMKKLAKSS